MIDRCSAAIPMARQINVLAYNAVSGAAHRHRDVCPRGIPRISKRIILPCLAGFTKGTIKATDDVDFVVTGIIRSAREIAHIRHVSARGPNAGTDVIDLEDVAWIEGGVKAAEYVNRVGGRVVNRRSIIKATWKIRQRST